MAIELMDLYAAKNEITSFLNFSYLDLDSELFARGYVLYPRPSEWRGETEVVIFRLKNTFSNINDPRNQTRVNIPESKAILQQCVYDAIGGTCCIGEAARKETAWNTTAGRNNVGVLCS